MANRPEYIIVHESVSRFGDVATIRRWHLERGFADIGYHYVIGNAYPTSAHLREDRPDLKHDGALLPGRDLDDDDDVEEEVGAHAPGFNARSIGICLIGDKGNFSDAQHDTLYAVLAALCRRYDIPPERVLGHCETPSGKSQGKTCPELPMGEVRARLRRRLAAENLVRASLPAGAERSA